MSGPAHPRRPVGRNILLLLVGIVGALAIYDSLRPKGGPSPAIEARLRCVARTVALHQAVHAAGKTALLDQVDALQNEVFAYVRHMQQRDDPARLHYRPIMIEEEAARDAAMAADPEAYVAATWAAVQACADDLGLTRPS